MHCHPLNWISILPKNFDPELYNSYPETLPEETAYAIDDFIRCGCNVFIAPEYLSQIITHRRLDEIIIEEILLPFDSFYIVFGNALRISNPTTNELIEGTYVSQSRDCFRGIDEGTIKIILVPNCSYNESEEEKTYSFWFEYQANERGFIQGGKLTNAQNHLDRRYKNSWEAMGKFNFEKMNRSATPPRFEESYEELVQEWTPSEKDVIWREIGDTCFQAVFNISQYLHQLGQRFSMIKVFQPLNVWNE